jgi:hypothetical protein
MIGGRIRFDGNPWPEGHPIAEFAWTARIADGRVRFDLHLRSADYDSERAIEDDEDVEYDSDWEAPIVWNNYHCCTLSSTFWGGENGFDVCAADEFSPAWLDGREFAVDTIEGEIDDPETLSFHIYLLGHDSAANHRIAFRRIGESNLFDIVWHGDIALTYAGSYALAHRFEASIRSAPFPSLASGSR